MTSANETHFEYVPVESSQIKEMAHDRETNKMRVRFIKGQVYEYDGVPLPVFQDIVGSDSVGKAFNSKIKANPTAFPFRQL